jgi:hypothetical protein
MTRLLFLKAVTFTRACLGLLLLVSINAWPQAEATGIEADPNPVETAPMRTPPPVGGEAYSTAFASETQPNNLRAGLTFNTAYSSNVQETTNPVSDVSYSIWPTLAVDATTTRIHWDLNYAPGFTFYQHTSSLNQGNQNLALNVRYRLSSHLTVSLQDSFQKTNNPFNQPNPLLATSVSGSASSQNVAIITPVGDYLNNAASAQLTYQVSADGMVGFSGTFTNLHYLSSAQASGLYDSNTNGASAFYSRRLWQKYYVGGSFQYQDILSSEAGSHSNAETQTQTIFFFCTAYLKPTLSLALSGGPQHYNASQPPQPASQSWSPMLMASLSWQGQRTSLAGSYTRIITGGGGLSGAYHSNAASVSARWQLSRAWSVGASASYSLYNALTPYFIGGNSGGHTASGTISVQRPLGEHLTMQAGYIQLQQSYTEVPAATAIPESNREFFSISYQFTRRLKR